MTEPFLEREVRKLLDNDEFVADVLRLACDYEMIFAQAKKFDLLTIRRTKKIVKKLVKMTKKLLALKNEAVKLASESKPNLDDILGTMMAYDDYLNRLTELTSDDLDNAALAFCNMAEISARMMPKNLTDAVSAARHKSLLMPLHALIAQYGLNQANLVKSGFGKPSRIAKLAVSIAFAAGDTNAKATVFAKL